MSPVNRESVGRNVGQNFVVILGVLSIVVSLIIGALSAHLHAQDDGGDLSRPCPHQCDGLTSSDPSYWLFGCFDLPASCKPKGGEETAAVRTVSTYQLVILPLLIITGIR